MTLDQAAGFRGRLNYSMREQGLTWRGFARALNINEHIDAGLIAAWRRGKLIPAPYMMSRLANRLHVDADWLATGERVAKDIPSHCQPRQNRADLKSIFLSEEFHAVATRFHCLVMDTKNKTIKGKK